MTELSYILKRILLIIPTLLVILVVTFTIVRLLPGDPASAMIGDRATDADVTRINKELGLDQPLPVQFVYFVRQIASGHLGNSYAMHAPVTSVIAERLPVTLLLTGMAALFSVVMAIPLAFVSALKRNTATDITIRGASQVTLSMPSFYIGLVLLTVFAAQLHWFPVGGYGDTWGQRVYHLFLPAMTLAVSITSVLIGSLRNSIIAVLDAEYITFARAKGLSTRVVLMRHVLRNSLIPMLSLFALNIGTTIGSAVITETVFAVPGIARLMVDSIFSRDYPMIQGLVIVLSVLVSLIFLLTDIVQVMIDPRRAR
ncbi:ABC transporter permease [Rouxiella badensis]|uniref:ABC transporter permease n=1 Tax=Rouxiella badensis TaxID=1646377 RepID=A0A1X0WET4_9GAMM|nr:ABC transporter permease [Rouxiella badensis]MCC3703797.1 ABC transporter permease [Rouxiella badensis]MCC3719825.1 ABC transporter permease [Rouxiella badensis]MCC3729323.1 ABC transporter permease [Rouxiella badensis]MCC3734739.1 ABC transporter permease [Rouxiella badensis]MCC3741490.1 ABC transporter permease [Rouxiella badensis]